MGRRIDFRPLKSENNSGKPWEKPGKIPKQHVSNMENGSRPISKVTAKKLAKIFNVSVERFI